MKVAVVVSELNIRGGTHKQVLRLCEYLQKKSIDFTIYTKHYDLSMTYPEFRQFEVKYLKEESTEWKNNKNKLMSKLSNIRVKIQEAKDLLAMIPEDTDIINIHDNGFIWLMYYAKKIKNTKVVWQINDLAYCFCVGVNNSLRDSKGLKLERFLQKVLTNKVDVITVNVTKNKYRVRKCYGREAKVLYCGVDVNAKLLPHKYSLCNKEEFRLLSSGVFFPYRNYEALIDVMELLISEKINIRLDIIGSIEISPAYTEKIKNMISQKGLDDRVKIWGQVNDDIYNKLHNEANAFAFLNINQSWGLAIFEAMSCGLPVLVSNSVGAIELLHDGEDALIVDPQEKEKISGLIKQLINDEAFYNKLSTSAMSAVNSYSWDSLYSSRLVDIFERLVENKTKNEG